MVSVELKVCLWNIQNYGTFSIKYGGSNSLRNQFIADFCARYKIDVLMIEELQEANADAVLADLVTKLRPTAADPQWHFSWCGCALKETVVAEAKLTADLDVKTGARTEAYAVVWRQSDNFRMVPGRYPIASDANAATSPLNLSQFGRPAGDMKVGSRTTYGALGGFVGFADGKANEYPYEWKAPPGNGYALMNNWPPLGLPTTGKGDVHRISWAKVRRPVYVVLELADRAKTLCPVLVYHAPSRAESAQWGALLAGLVRELYVTNKIDPATNRPTDDLQPVDKAIFGGDFNYDPGKEWPGFYVYFPMAQKKEYDGGANCLVAPDTAAASAARRTTVQILDRLTRKPIIKDSVDDYLFSKIDFAFFSRKGGMTATRVNLVQDIMSSTISYISSISAVTDMLKDIYRKTRRSRGRQRIDPKLGPQMLGPKGWTPMINGAGGGTFVDWDESLAQLESMNITKPRCAAEFIHLFVSDHLPLVVTLQFDK